MAFKQSSNHAAGDEFRCIVYTIIESTHNIIIIIIFIRYSDFLEMLMCINEYQCRLHEDAFCEVVYALLANSGTVPLKEEFPKVADNEIIKVNFI
jgi:hypothetical protein